MATPSWIKHFDENRLKNDNYDETWSTTMLSDFTETSVSTNKPQVVYTFFILQQKYLVLIKYNVLHSYRCMSTGFKAHLGAFTFLLYNEVPSAVHIYMTIPNM